MTICLKAWIYNFSGEVEQYAQITCPLDDYFENLMLIESKCLSSAGNGRAYLTQTELVFSSKKMKK